MNRILIILFLSTLPSGCIHHCMGLTKVGDLVVPTAMDIAALGCP